jgi:hypothetical protein
MHVIEGMPSSGLRRFSVDSFKRRRVAWLLDRRDGGFRSSRRSLCHRQRRYIALADPSDAPTCQSDEL